MHSQDLFDIGQWYVITFKILDEHVDEHMTFHGGLKCLWYVCFHHAIVQSLGCGTRKNKVCNCQQFQRRREQKKIVNDGIVFGLAYGGGETDANFMPYTEFIMADRSGRPRYECMKTRGVRINTLVLIWR